MGEEEKKQLLVEGLDIYSADQTTLLGHVHKMVEDLALERAERARAQAEADMARIGWENTESELEAARLDLIKLQLEKTEVKKESYHDVYLPVPDCLELREAMGERVADMMASLPSQLDKRLPLITMAEKWKEMEDAGPEVVRAVDNHLSYAEENLYQIIKSLQNVHERQRFLRTFYEVQLAQVEEEKNNLIDRLKFENEKNFKEIHNFFKKVVQNNLFLVMSLKQKIIGLQSLKEQRLSAIADAERKTNSLKDNTRSIMIQIEEGKRRVKGYDENKNLIKKYERMIRAKEEQIIQMCEKKRKLEEDLENTLDKKAEYISIIEKMQKKRKEYQEEYTSPNMLQGFTTILTKLSDVLNNEGKVEEGSPGVLSIIERTLRNEKTILDDITMRIAKETNNTNYIIDQVELQFDTLGIEGNNRFHKLEQ